MKETLNSKLYILVVIGIVSAFGPFVTDFYLPALPVLAGYFDTTASLVQLSLTFSMVGLAVGQLVIGPLSDKYGRKKTLMASLVLFCISTIGCLYASDIYVFIFLIFGAFRHICPVPLRLLPCPSDMRGNSIQLSQAFSVFFELSQCLHPPE